MAFEYVCDGWACVDCVMVIANGEYPPENTEEQNTEYQARIDQNTEGLDVALGMMREKHACATNYTITDSSGDHEYRADSSDDAFSDHEYKVWSGSLVSTRETIPGEVTGQMTLAGDVADVPANVTRELVTFDDGTTEIITITAHELQTVDDCDDETLTFTWSACDVCGSNLGGARDAVTFFKIVPD